MTLYTKKLHLCRHGLLKNRATGFPRMDVHQGMANATLKTTLTLSCEESWRIRRELFGFNKTLPVTPEAQEALKAERDLVVSRAYKSL